MQVALPPPLLLLLLLERRWRSKRLRHILRMQ
jgi:hypothetical protein